MEKFMIAMCFLLVGFVAGSLNGQKETLAGTKWTETETYKEHIHAAYELGRESIVLDAVNGELKRGSHDG